MGNLSPAPDSTSSNEPRRYRAVPFRGAPFKAPMLPIRATMWGYSDTLVQAYGCHDVAFNGEEATWDPSFSVLTTKNGIKFDFFESVVTTGAEFSFNQPIVPLAHVAMMEDTTKNPPIVMRVLFVNDKVFSWPYPPEGYASWDNAFDAWERRMP